MPREDLFELAAANVATLESLLEAARTTLVASAAALLGSFIALVAKYGRIGINMRPWVAGQLLANGSYENMHEWAVRQARLSGRPYGIIVKERLGPYYDRRVAFEQTFHNGETFRYGCLNIGGAGTPSYGPFCVVLRGEFGAKERDVAYLKGDSLNDYVHATAGVDVARLRLDLAPHSHRQVLAALKHLSEMATIAEDMWPSLVCCSKSCIEAVFVAAIEIGVVAEIRVTSDYYRELFDLAFDNFARKLSDAERALIHDFTQILELSRGRGIPIVEV